MKLAIFATITVTLTNAPGYAQTENRQCDPNDPKSCVQGLTEGQQAPFTGLLLTPKRAAKLAVMAEGCQAKIDIMLEEAKETEKARFQNVTTILKNNLDSFNFQKDLLLQRLKDAKELYSPDWYEKPAFVAGTTAIITVGILVLSVKTIQVLK